MTTTDLVWVGVGFLGQALFFGRMLVQWIVSERRKVSIVPLSFWYLSLGGGLILLTYAAHRRDPVFVAGQAFGCVVYLRNLALIHGKRREEGPAPPIP